MLNGNMLKLSDIVDNFRNEYLESCKENNPNFNSGSKTGFSRRQIEIEINKIAVRNPNENCWRILPEFCEKFNIENVEVFKGTTEIVEKLKKLSKTKINNELSNEGI